MRSVNALTLKNGHESTIIEWCNQNNMTVRRLALNCNIIIQYAYDLAYGLMSPIYLKGKLAGQVKPVVRIIEEYTGWSKDKLFPKYFCALDQLGISEDMSSVGEYLKSIYIDREMDTDSIIDLITLKEIRNYIYDVSDLHNIEPGKLMTMTQRNGTMFIDYFYNGYTLAEIAVVWNRSAESVRRIIDRLVRMIKRWILRIIDVRKQPKPTVLCNSDAPVLVAESSDVRSFIKLMAFFKRLPSDVRYSQVRFIDPEHKFIGTTLNMNIYRKEFFVTKQRNRVLYDVMRELDTLIECDQTSEKKILQAVSDIVIHPPKILRRSYVIDHISCVTISKSTCTTIQLGYQTHPEECNICPQ